MSFFHKKNVTKCFGHHYAIWTSDSNFLLDQNYFFEPARHWQRFITIFNCRYHTSNHQSMCHKPTSLSPINCQSVDNCCIIINTLINLHDPNLPAKVSNRSITGYHLNTFTMTDSSKIIYKIYMIDLDRRPVSNRRPLLKSASTDIIISNHSPI